MAMTNDPRLLDDALLLERVRALVVRSNENEAELLEHLAEVDGRKLFLPNHTSMLPSRGEIEMTSSSAAGLATCKEGRLTGAGI